MLYTYPDYYDRFACVADKCEDTCCAGWQILIDDESLARYKENHRDDKRIDWENEVFQHCNGKRCAFLNDKNLCDMYTQWGADSLCVTCDRYPRHIEEFENVREYTLSLSCPEVAKILLNYKDKVTFEEKEDEEDEVDEEFDVLLYSVLQDTRQWMYDIIQNRDLPIQVRAAIMLEIGSACQDCIDEGNVFNISDMLYEYKEKLNNGYANELLQDINYYEYTLPRFRRLYDLEVLNDLWADMTDEAAQLIYGENLEKCNMLHKSFDEWLCKNVSQHNIMWEQILIYFVSTYFCGAVYDGNIIGKLEMAVTSLVCIYEMLMARWIKNNEKLSFEDIVFVTYMYSRELEHSDINLDTMEDID